MSWLGRFRRKRVPGGATMDRGATKEDLDELIEFARNRHGVEFYIEPETFVTSVTAIAVAHDGEWKRRRVGSAAVMRKAARKLSLPVYEVHATGYPRRMREWNARNWEEP